MIHQEENYSLSLLFLKRYAMKSSRSYWGWFQWNKKGDSAPNDNLMTDERKQRLKWRLRLMIALALPVFLETLDYTGELQLKKWVEID